jgi:hypothetical protein
VLDENASLGAPAHVTVLFPLAPPRTLDESVLARVGSTVGAIPAGELTLSLR